ncbi:MAG: divergent polysaccharide deacetylase family protein [Rhodospirillales bacterium]|nr:divergent polysaccharide deacetylase family protein [Rhodospirillales bacterium]
MRALVWFWAVVLMLAGGVGAVLAWLGPPAREAVPVADVARPAAPPAPLPLATGPKIAILIAGIGMRTHQSRVAIASLPPAVSLAISPYAPDPAAAALAARKAGHEVLVSLPMQPGQGAIADAGDEELAASQPADVTASRLAWALGRVPAPAGATSLLAPGLDGDAFTASPALASVMDKLASRHLWFLDGRRATMLDAPATTPAHALAALIALARRKGSAIGAAGAPSPDLVAALERLLPGLAARGVRLVPVGQIISQAKQ